MEDNKIAIVTLYNHKGGVSKTTTSFNLAHLLAAQGKRVLLVDADAQCNLTELCLGQLIARLDAEAEESGEETPLPGTTVLAALEPRIAGTVPEVDISKIETVEVVHNLDILRGSVDLTTIEDDIAEAHTQRFANRTNLMRTYVAIGDMLVRLQDARNYDYIFIDLGPSAGALTRSFFLAADAFFVPVSPDRFNVQAIGTLGSIVARWLEDHEQVRENYKELGLPVRPGRPIFLGAISQFFKVYRGKPKPGFEMWMGRIPQRIADRLVPTLNRFSSETRDLCPYKGHEVIAAKIPDFQSLAPLMQEVGKAVFFIDQEDTALVVPSGQKWVGSTWRDAQERMEKIKECFEQLSTRLKTL